MACAQVGTLADLAKKDGQVSRFVLVSSGGVTHYTDYKSPTLQVSVCLRFRAHDLTFRVLGSQFFQQPLLLLTIARSDSA